MAAPRHSITSHLLHLFDLFGFAVITVALLRISARPAETPHHSSCSEIPPLVRRLLILLFLALMVALGGCFLVMRVLRMIGRLPVEQQLEEFQRQCQFWGVDFVDEEDGEEWEEEEDEEGGFVDEGFWEEGSDDDDSGSDSGSGSDSE